MTRPDWPVIGFVIGFFAVMVLVLRVFGGDGWAVMVFVTAAFLVGVWMSRFDRTGSGDR